MEKAEIKRIVTGPDGTFGVFVFGGRPLCVTAEPPWKDNKRLISCIPDGIYKCTPHNGIKYRNVWALNNVKNREAILIHQGNFPLQDTNGCILVGSSYIMNGTMGISASVKTLNVLRQLLPKEFSLTVSGLGFVL